MSKKLKGLKKKCEGKKESRNLYVAIFLLYANNLSTNFIIFVLHYRIIPYVQNLHIWSVKLISQKINDLALLLTI